MHSRLPLLALTLLASRGALGEEASPPNARTWRTHPEIVAIRALYADHQKLRREHALKAERKAYDCDATVETERTVLRDASGRIRVYLSRILGEDSGYTTEHHYDDQQHLRFLLVTGRAVNDSVLEARLYFDPRGALLWEERKLVKGPGWTFANPWPEEFITRDAEKTFRALPHADCTPHRGE